MILDVGCGSTPRGDVNVDLYTAKNEHRPYATINTKRTPNFVIADARFLPFRGNLFNLVTSHHLLEHLLCPSMALNEMLRCSKSHVFFEVPHRFSGRQGSIKIHVQKFNIANLTKFLQRFPIHFSMSLTYKYFPHQYIPLIRLPHLIQVEIEKLQEVGES